MRRRPLATVAAASLAGTAVAACLVLRPDVAPAAAHPSSHSTSSPAASSPADGMHVAFDDEFDGNHLAADTWHTCFWWAPSTCTIETHGELGLYTSRNVSIGDGVLTLRARREEAVGWNGKTYDYTTGLVSTGGSSYSSPVKDPGFTFTYGYVESRIKVPAGRGLCPAFWLAPADHTWPPEIDIMEMLGNEPTRTTMHFHYQRANGTHATVGDGWSGPDFSGDWHTFGVDWEPGSLVWYVDGVERARFADATVTDQAAYLVLNLAVGGSWAGSPENSTVLPADLLVDYVRVYQR